MSLTNETSVGSGSRRLEALVGIEALRSLRADRYVLNRLVAELKTPRESIEEKIAQLSEDLKIAQKKLEQVSASALADLVPKLISEHSIDRNGLNIISKNLGALDSAESLRNLVVLTRDKLQATKAVVLLGAVINDKPAVVVASTPDAIAKGVLANNLAKIVSNVLGGGGGGKPDLAQGGGTNVLRLDDAIGEAIKTIE